jgi:SAM-dependent methyltransferase
MIDFDPGSFKDPDGRVFRSGEHIFRTVTPAALGRFEHLRNSGLIDALAAPGLLMPTTIESAEAFGLDAAAVGDRVIRQAAVPLVSYSYEWTFSMLQDAALVTLDILQAALARDVVLKDAPAFNILFEGTCPRLVDVLSLEAYQPGALWAGYTQFCRSFLAPLLVAAHTGMAVGPLLRGHLGELPLGDAARLLGWRRVLRPGVATHILLQSRLEQGFGKRPDDVGKAAAATAHPKAVLVKTVGRIRALVASLRYRRSSAWTGYSDANTYDEERRALKAGFVERALSEGTPRVVLDLGCNTGEYSRLALRHARHVVALDGDADSVDALYRAERGSTKLSPLISDLHNPTPAQGWQLRERAALLDRLKGDFVLALALVHHLRISAGVPLADVIGFLLDRAPEGIIEWVDREDPMVKQMLRLRPDVYPDYDWPTFQSILNTHARVLSVSGAEGATRRLCHFSRR